MAEAALIFDCDGVLIDSEHLASRVESELTRELGLSLSTEEAHAMFLGKTVDGVLDAIAQRTGQRPGAAWVYNWAFATAHAFHRELVVVEQLRDALEALRARGHRMAVASQSSLARVRFSLDVTGLAPLFGEHVYVSSMVARPKPAPDVYLFAAARLGATPADCVVIEDSPAGAAAALQAGMRAILFSAGSAADAGHGVLMKSGPQVIRSMAVLPATISGA
ncbi:MAG TPA: HAD family phosphatase [Steroidobacteraceae bacterium]|nr:HAD family phosphatase [Steroidobacteraceae bacterium]